MLEEQLETSKKMLKALTVINEAPNEIRKKKQKYQHGRNIIWRFAHSQFLWNLVLGVYWLLTSPNLN